MKLFDQLLPVILLLLPLFLTVSYFVYDKKRLSAKRKNPINIDLLRGPGQSLLEKIEDIQLDIDSYLILQLITPFVIYIFFLKSNQSLSTIIIFTGTGLIVLGFSCYKLFTFIKLKRKMSLGYDAELAIGQELNTLMRDGYHVFHDFPANNYNIDHVVVGANGVFAIETKGRSKPVQKNGKSEYKVIYNGKKLTFPSWTEENSLDQAKRQANSLQKWLTSAIGEPIEVNPVLAIPGWYIERTSNQGILVINGKNSLKALRTANGIQLNNKLISQVAHQLDQRCRTVKPKT